MEHENTRVGDYKALGFPLLVYDSETWRITAEDKSTITITEIKFMRKDRKMYI
jgi:hypothetical protein